VLATGAGAGIVLTGDSVVVAVEAVRVVTRAAVPEEEDLRGLLGGEVGAVLVRGRGRRCAGEDQCPERDYREEDGDEAKRGLHGAHLSVRMDISTES
jgi:hypothetical protein